MLKRLSIVYAAREAVDGAGVRLKRVFGGMSSVPFTYPFLLPAGKPLKESLACYGPNNC